MPSVTNEVVRSKPAAQRFVDTFEIWNRKVHYYLGLYFLFFLWLFAFTGLVLNHGSWQSHGPQRRVARFERQIQSPPAGSNLDQAKDLMRQLGIRGEVQWPNAPSEPGHFNFLATRPGHNFDIKADLKQGLATIERTDFSLWVMFRILHTFTGVRMLDTRNQRDWALTTIWVLAMDGLAVGLVLMVFSSYYMWWGLRQKRSLGLVALAVGFVICGFMVFGLQWMYS